MNDVPDAVAVTNLLYRYAELMDLGDFEAVADLLADCVITVEGVPGEQRGRATILAMYVDWTRRYEDGTPRSRHLLSNPIVEVDAEAGTATVRSSYTVFQQTDVLALQPIIIGRYHDSFARGETVDDGDRGWHFTHRHLFTDLTGDLSQHLLHGLR
ncbi:MAG TPA: nuclear transport factor 2 family protein [Acidimicrobiales bacterium]